MTTDSYHHGDLRAALLRAATAVLERDGASAISLRGLARTVGVSHAAPVHHFRSRGELLAELAADGYSQLADALTDAQNTAPPSMRLAVSGRAYVRFALANPERYRLMFTSRLNQTDCPPRLDAESSRAFRALLRAAHTSETTADRATFRMGAPELRAWAVVHGAVMLWLDGQLTGALTESEFIERMDEVVGGPTGGQTASPG